MTIKNTKRMRLNAWTPAKVVGYNKKSKKWD